MISDYDEVDLRRAAADWHGGQASPLYAYASTGTVVAGLDDEIWYCLAAIQRGELDVDSDPGIELGRLVALLHHIEPEAAKLQARQIGREHGEDAVAWWHQYTLGGRAVDDPAETARRVLAGIGDGDPAILDSLPPMIDDYTPAHLQRDCDWRDVDWTEPPAGYRPADQRWADVAADVWDAYQGAVHDAVHEFVVEACRTALDEASPAIHPSPSVHIGSGEPAQDASDRQVARARYMGAWAAVAEASALRLTGDQAWAVAIQGEEPPVAAPELAGAPGRDPASALLVDRLTEMGDLSDAGVGHLAGVPLEVRRAWESGRDAVWRMAARATALRALDLREPAGFLRRIVDDRLRALAEETRVEPAPAAPQPYIRPAATGPGGAAADDVPAGWTVEPIGLWDGYEAEAVYDPRRFDITVTSPSGGLGTEVLEAEAWDRHATSGQVVLWVRDRVEAARRSLARIDQRSAVGPTGAGHRLEALVQGLEL